MSGRGDPSGLQREQRDDPGRDGRGERLAEVRAERNVLPGLDVACGPVVEQHDAEDVSLGVVGGDAGPHRVPGADHEAQLGLDVEAYGRAEDRQLVAGTSPLTGRADDLRTGDHDRRGPAVIADGQVLPVRHQRLGGLRAEQPAQVGRVVLRGVEVDVVGDLEREVERHRPEVVHGRVRHVALDPLRDRRADLDPALVPLRHERVEAARGEDVVAEQERQVDHVVAQPDADPRVLPGNGVDAVGKVGQAVERALRNADGGHTRSFG